MCKLTAHMTSHASELTCVLFLQQHSSQTVFVHTTRRCYYKAARWGSSGHSPTLNRGLVWFGVNSYFRLSQNSLWRAFVVRATSSRTYFLACCAADPPSSYFLSWNSLLVAVAVHKSLFRMPIWLSDLGSCLLNCTDSRIRGFNIWHHGQKRDTMLRGSCVISDTIISIIRNLTGLFRNRRPWT